MPEYSALDRLQRALNPLPGAAVDGQHALSTTGTINIIGGGSGGTSMVDNNPFTPGSTTVTPMAGYRGGRQVASGNAAAVSIDGSGNLQVNVVAGGAGGGIANISVRGTSNSDIHVGFASGAGLQQDGGAALPITGTVAVGGIAGSVFVTQGTLPMPVVGSMSVTPLASFTVNMGSIPTVNIGLGTVNIGNNPTVLVGSIAAGSMNVLAGQAGAPWSMVGSVNVSGTISIGAGGGGGGGFASVAVYGSPANPVYNVGSVNVVNTVAVTTSSLLYADATNSAMRVNVVAGGAGGGVSNITVRGTANTDIHVGFASGAGTLVDGGAAVPVNIVAGAAGGFATVAIYGSPNFPAYVLGTINVSNFSAGSGFATAAVYGSPAFPVYAIGSVNVVNNVGVTQVTSPWVVTGSVNITGSINPVGIFGSLGAMVGSVNITGSLNPVGVFGSVNALASLAGVTANGSLALDVDPRGNLVATTWIISMTASSQTQIAGTAPANQRIYLSSYHLVSDGTAYMQWMSPSGVALTGSMMLLPGAGFALAGAFPNGPVMVGSQQSGLYIKAVGTINIGGFAVGWVGT